MKRREFMSVAVAVVGSPVWFESARAAGFSEADAAAGVRTALERGVEFAVALLGKSGGFLDNPKVRIPLPGYLNQAAQGLKLIGQQKRVDELVLAMNRAAEAAVPEGKAVLLNAVKAMSVDDAKRIITGGDTSVTDFFAAKTRQPLSVKFLPIVSRETEKVGLAEKYNAVAGKAAGMGLLKPQDANVEQYVTGKTLDGLYLVIGEEERKIRKDPIGTGSALLAKVFGR
jgi:hypothetical protein